jgi:hypothetical protein
LPLKAIVSYFKCDCPSHVTEHPTSFASLF